MKSLLLTVVLLVLIGCGRKETPGEANSPVVAEDNDMPPIGLITASREVLSGKDLPPRSILIFFQPDCDHCQREAESIAANLPAFEGYTLYFISPADFNEIEPFASDYGLASRTNVHFVRTTTDAILKSVGRISAPSMFIYSSEKKLVKHLDGETPIEEILRYL